MTGMYGVLNVASGALLTHRKSINVIGNNIANVNTPGYSRQNLVLETRTPALSSIGPVGTGVEAVAVQRVYDRFLGLQINNENESLGRWEARKDSLELAEVVLDESGAFGLSQSLGEFWGAWQNLSNNPSGHNERVVLQANAEGLTAAFNRVYADLENAQRGFDASIEGAVARINQLSQQIVDINRKILSVEVSGHVANEYRDQRDFALKEMAGLIDINSFEDDNGQVSVLTGTGQSLVGGESSLNLLTQINGFGLKDIAWESPDGTPVNITANISNGKLKGWLEARDIDVRGYMRQLDTLAEGLMGEVNGLHRAGFGLDGSNGNDFFTGLATATGNMDSQLTITAQPGGSGNIQITVVGGGVAVPALTTDAITGDIRIAIADGVTTAGDIASALQAHSGINTVVAGAPAAVWDLSAGSNTTTLSGGNSANTLEMNLAITNDLDLIAASSTLAGIPGNNSQAIEITKLQHALTMNGNSATFEGHFNTLIRTVGNDMKNATAYFDHQSDMVVQLENRLESVSGVSLDEEMINLVKFQNAYDAAAKLVATADELLQTVLNLV